MIKKIIVIALLLVIASLLLLSFMVSLDIALSTILILLSIQVFVSTLLVMLALWIVARSLFSKSSRHGLELRRMTAELSRLEEVHSFAERASRQALLAQREGRATTKSVKGVSAAVGRLERDGAKNRQEFAELNRRIGAVMTLYPMLPDEVNPEFEDGGGESAKG